MHIESKMQPITLASFSSLDFDLVLDWASVETKVKKMNFRKDPFEINTLIDKKET